jgi:serine protease AprX
MELPFYTTASGTSFSAPQVAGAVALMLEANPGLQPSEVKDILQRTSTPLPPYFRHEVGAGMLNSYAAVLQAAFSNRQIGIWRGELERAQVKFITDVPRYFSGTAYPGTTAETSVVFQANAVQSSIYLAWGNILSPNDLALSVKDMGGIVRGESNNLNLPGLGGHRERVTFNMPPSETWRVLVNHTAGVGTVQPFQGAIETTRVEFANLNDIQSLSAESQAAIKESLQSFQILTEGQRFRPANIVTRIDLAGALVRGGRVPQFMAAAPIFTDVRVASMRGVAESVQKSSLFYDAQQNGRFRPFDGTTRLIAAVALVKAAGLQSLAEQTVTVPVADATLIPAAYRGYVAVALQKGLLRKQGEFFLPSNSLTRADLAVAMSALNRIFTE